VTLSDAEQANKFFFDYFRARLEFIQENGLNENMNQIEGLILMSCYLDSLAGYRYGEKSSGKRFRDFVLEFSGQREIWTRVALPLLEYRLQAEGKDSMASVVRSMGTEVESRMRTYEEDLRYGDMLEKIYDSNERQWFEREAKSVKGYEYVSILWERYRCKSVHEASSDPDRAESLHGEKNMPFYAQYLDEPKPGLILSSEWHFCIPNVFIYSTLTNCMSNFESYVKSNGLDIRQLARQ